MGKALCSGGFEALRADRLPEGSILCFRGRGGVGRGGGGGGASGVMRFEHEE